MAHPPDTNGTLSTSDINDLIRQFELSTASAFSYADTRPLYRIHNAKAMSEASRAAEIKFDILLFDLKPSLDADGRFKPLWGPSDGAPGVYPDITRDFPDEALTYYAGRLADPSVNVAHRAYYADFLFESNRWRKTPRLRLVHDAIESYLKVSEEAEHTAEWDAAIDSTCRALALSARTNQRALLSQSVGRCADVIRNLENLQERMRFRRIYRVVRSLLDSWTKVRTLTDGKELAQIIDRAETVLGADKVEMFAMQRSFLDLRVDLARQEGDHGTAGDYRRRHAETFVAEAEYKATHYGAAGNAAAAIAYEHALQAYVQLGNQPHIVERLKTKLREHHYLASQQQHARIIVPIELDQESAKSWVAAYAKMAIEDAFAQLTHDPILTPKYETERQRAAERMKDMGGLEDLFSTEVVNEDSILKHVTTNEEKLDLYTVQNMVFHTQLSAIEFLGPILDMLRRQHPEFLEGFLRLLRKSVVFSTERVAFVHAALNAYLNLDFVSAVTLMVFQIEGALRDLLGLLGQETFTYRDGRMRQRDLDDVLTRLESRGIDLDLTRLVRYWLQDVMGPNLRNEIAHGIASIKHMNRMTAEILMVILLRIALLPLVPTEQAAEPK